MVSAPDIARAGYHRSEEKEDHEEADVDSEPRLRPRARISVSRTWQHTRVNRQRFTPAPDAMSAPDTDSIRSASTGHCCGGTDLDPSESVTVGEVQRDEREQQKGERGASDYACSRRENRRQDRAFGRKGIANRDIDTGHRVGRA